MRGHCATAARPPRVRVASAEWLLQPLVVGHTSLWRTYAAAATGEVVLGTHVDLIGEPYVGTPAEVITGVPARSV